MKTTILKHRFLYLFILLGLTLSFNGCSSDDDDETETQTFLEKYDGTKWVHTRGNSSYFIRINNNPNNIWEYWNNEEGCYGYDRMFDNDESTTEILVNSGDKLVFRDNYISGSYETSTYTVLDGTLKEEYVYTDKNGVSENDEPWFYDKTTVNVDSFELCN